MAGGIGGFISGLFGSDNEEHAQADRPDAMNYMYGGPGGADAAANRYKGMAEGAQNRPGVGINFTNADGQRNNALQVREQQKGLANAMTARALGQTPTIAEQAGARNMQRSFAQQTSLGASARGAGALANAQRNAANNIANSSSAMSNDINIAAANEKMAAEQAANQAWGAMRGQDLGAQAQDAGQATAQAGFDDAQKARNDAMTMGMSNLEHGVRSTDLAAHGNFEGQKTANNLGAAGINAGVAGQNANMNQANAMNLIGAAQQGAGAAVSLSDARAKIPMRAEGGPVASGRPYIVGERGPEVIVPAQSGTVVPNHALSPADLVTSTWGTSAANQQAAARDVSQQLTEDRTAGQQSTALANATESPWERDARRYEALKRSNPEFITDEDRSEARRARGVLKGARDTKGGPEEKETKEEKAAVVDGKALPKPTLGSVLGGMGKDTMQRAAYVDTGYHGSGGYVPPQLIPLRANGGPVTAGQPYIVGERGPEMLMPLSGPMAGPMGGANGASYGRGSATGPAVSNPLSGSTYEMTSAGGRGQGMDIGATIKQQASTATGHPMKAMFSDERAKRSVPMNWEENDKQDAKERHLRDPKDFKRDTAADQKAVKRKYEDKAGKDADALMASFKTSLDRGPSVGRLVADFDADAPKDERMAYMVSDERAKREAFESGASYATEHLTGEKMKPWSGEEEAPAKFEPAPHPNPLPDPPPPPMKGSNRNPERYRGPSEDRLYSANPDAPAHLRPPPEPERAIGFSAKRPADPGQAEANRSMAGMTYAYKPEYTPPEQKPGEVNHGPTVQRMAQSDIARTAVKVDPTTGLGVIDKDKALKLVMSGVSDLQRQNDELRRTMQRRSSGSAGRKR